MSLPKIKEEDRFSYADYLTWDDEKRWELIDGEAICMSPGPNRLHQKWLGELFVQFHTHLDGKPCEVFLAPFDVRLPDHANATDEEIVTVVQPDIMVVCDPDKIDDRGVNGAPDLVIEIISPSTAKRDITTKYDLYQRHGVKEYWLVYPNDRTLLVYRLTETGKYSQPDVFGEADSVPVPLLGDLIVEMGNVFK
ncbi:MAG TPA: Uma2 family endonuclease [Desulfuromonadales bacterium]|nr:Uma2 family endonuclease [Desulfuromonadales bacterium]